MISPRATYRLQLRSDFGFHQAAEVADYLAALGISHLYSSPYLQASPGSTHGYDVVDPRRVNRELGGEAGHASFCEELGAAGLGQLLDLVPNHMAISGPENEWWWDVLRNGPSSAYAAWFDVDWEPPEEKLRNLVLLPVLPDHYGRVLESGGLRIVREGESFTVRLGDTAYPLSPRSVKSLLERAIGHRPTPSMPPSVLALDPAIGEALDRVIREVNGDPDLLDGILDQQNYRLAHWRTGNRELDYRRFFDVDDLAALRVEDPEVFHATHGLVLEWVRKGVLDGLRIDHVDGLRRPREYLARIRAEAPDGWLLVEKVLEPGEALRESWPVDGTTGYDFLNDVGGLFLDPDGEEHLTSFYREITEDDAGWADVVLNSKGHVLEKVLASDLNRLTHLFVGICEANRRFRDFTRYQLREVLRKVAASFPVYRTYVEEDGTASLQDLAVLGEAFEDAASRAPELDQELFEFLHSILSGDRGSPGSPEAELRMRFQQFTGPVMAKAVEDTALYRYNRFLPLNEVGGDPDRFGLSPESFHEGCRLRADLWPRSMLALSTHDTKRSEDVRARLFLISEIPQDWARTVRRWMAMNRRHRSREGFPDAGTEYLFYQTLVGAHPLPEDRALPFLLKAVREAKTHTSWIDPNEAYEAGLRSFAHGLYADPTFMTELERFAQPLVHAGRVNSIAQKLLQLTAPGVPDVYQGTELWDLSLVDPDNRRPVDFRARRSLLQALERATPEQVMARVDEGAPKLWVVRQALLLRKERPEAFGSRGSYQPLYPEGQMAGHVVALLRGGEVVAVVPRMVMGLKRGGGWGDTSLTLPGGVWVDRMTGRSDLHGTISLARLLGRFPVALLARAPAG